MNTILTNVAIALSVLAVYAVFRSIREPDAADKFYVAAIAFLVAVVSWVCLSLAQQMPPD